MSRFRITALSALPILDSRGRPTLQVNVIGAGGVRTSAAVPSGASTGSREALERRDHNPKRYGGLGVDAAVAAVCGQIEQVVATSTGWQDLAELDQALIALDGTSNKSRLGANAILGVSLASARAFAARTGTPLWRYLSTPQVPMRLPVPHFNVLNGGAHATNRLDFEEFMLAPLGAPSYLEALRAGAEIYTVLRGLLADRGEHTGLGDEGGFAPDIDETQALSLLVEAIERAGYQPGRNGVAIALDPAATSFHTGGVYRVGDRGHTTTQMIDWYEQLIEQYPIWSIEDGLAEDDWDGWMSLTRRLGGRVQLVGDDLFVTDPATITRAASLGAGNAALIKPNQVGTVTETLAAIAAAQDAGYPQMISHRSGETHDTFIADLAVGSGCGQIKAGAPARGERVAKYNRLAQIAAVEPTLGYAIF